MQKHLSYFETLKKKPTSPTLPALQVHFIMVIPEDAIPLSQEHRGHLVKSDLAREKFEGNV